MTPRAGVAATLNEIADAAGVGVQIVESSSARGRRRAGGLRVSGLDPLVANEGRVVVFGLRAGDADRALETMRTSRRRTNRAHRRGRRHHPESSLRRLASRLPRGGSTAGRATAAHLLDVRPRHSRKPRDPSRQTPRTR